MKPFLILQLRPLDAAADSEYDAFLKYGGLRENNVLRIRMEAESIADIEAHDFAGIIVGGGPSNVSDSKESKAAYQIRFENELKQLFDQVYEDDFPYLGSCYGLGAFVSYRGGVVSKEKYSERVGKVHIHLSEAASIDPLVEGLPKQFVALGGHKEACQEVPADAELLGSSEACPVQLLRFKKNIYATQFHTELDVPGIVERIHFYKHHGYFDPNEAHKLIDEMKGLEITVPQMILRRFVERYRKSV